MDIHTEAVQKLYVTYFSRPADAPGLVFWVKAVAAANNDIAALSAAFAASQEYRDMYVGKSDAEIVDTIYHNLFGRPAEAAALQFWSKALASKAMTIDNAVLTISAAARSDDAVVFGNKVIAADAFSSALDTTQKIAGYAGSRANIAAKTWLSDVTTNASLTNATTPVALVDAVSTVVQAGSAPVVPEVLTVGTDNIFGSAGDDIFMASVDATPDSAWNTLGANDRLDGGTGQDTLQLAAFTRVDDALLANIRNIEILELHGGGAVELKTADLVGLKLVDGLAATGVLTIAADAGVTIKGGAGNDMLTARGAGAILFGGAGDDVLKLSGPAGLALLTGGTGNDLFDVGAVTLANGGVAATVTDFAKGDRIAFAGGLVTSFVSAKVTLSSDASFDAYLGQALRVADAASVGSGLAWFQYKGDTFVVQDVNGNGTYDGGADIVVKLVGLVGLDTAAVSAGGVLTFS
ncbi:DUF4214 domain-containing protein [Massilia yuzhufengensis]|uniref:DUF4214 domain-containing protein n=1 Tax=Massilia yuzhufengensis TaxID=1164594 RepID=A0A1I1LA74_9BURK|nr:DUF4214 domain-containing protein [Massilia yuzhufengensis]SFC69919.1 protein of unknown function [Massilia yuzhufengensis]